MVFAGAAAHAAPIAPDVPATPVPGAALVAAFAAVGPEADEVDGGISQQFAESLGARPGFSVKFVPRSSGNWLTPPQGAGATTGGWLSFVMVATGEHRDAVVLVPDEKGTAVLAAVRRPCHYGGKARRDWVDPGPGQIVDNAMKEIAADLGHRWSTTWASRPERRVKVTVAGWKVAAGELGGGLDAAIKGKESETEKMEAALMPALDGATVLAFAALAEAGFEPTTQDAPASLRIEVAQSVDHDALRLTLTRDGKETKLVDRVVQRPAIYEHLLAAGRKMLVWGDTVRDVAKVGVASAEPLALGVGPGEGGAGASGPAGKAGGAIVVASVGLDLCGIDPATGQDKWRIVAGERSSPRFVAVQGLGQGAGAGAVVRVMHDAAKVDLATGKVESVAGAAPATGGAIALLPDGRAAVVQDVAVSLQGKGKEIWKVAFAEPILAGPAVAGERVIVGVTGGELVALSLADGKELWRKATGLRLSGPISLVGGAGDRLIVGSAEGTWRAFASADGAPAWDYAGKDVPLARPIEVNGQLLLADKGNHVALVDPANGAAKATFNSPTWLRGVMVTPGANPGAKRWVVCTDLRGTVSFLSPADLKPVRRIELATRLNPGIVAGDLPLAWAGHDDLEQKAPGVVVGDVDGWLYLIDMPK
ncbi:MAG: PQQ-binding-like beta-propeller repeat protein [Planctomycetota bacterium]|nr:PQQ-binding-like beta-propeller repeat protein [Planctomycetota bacterium]